MKRFSLPLFVESEPAIYQIVLNRFRTLDHKAWMHREPALYREVTARFPQLDTTAWRLQDQELYQRMRQRYLTEKVSRKFLVMG